MKVKISPSRNIKVFLIAFFICGGSLFLCCINLFVFTWPWSFIQWMIIGIFFGLSLSLLIASFFTNYYIINDSDFEVHKFGSTAIFDYKNIIFIDEVEGNKGKTIAYMIKMDPKMRYLSFDKDGKLYETMIKKCKNRITREEFVKNFPNIRL